MLESIPRPIWWLPSLGVFLVLAIEVGLFINPSLLYGDPGAGRHLRTAEYILETHQVPRRDPLSFTHAGAPWIDYEWGFEATLGELNRLGGLGLIAAFCTAIFAATILCVYRTLLQSGFSFSVVLLVTGLTFLTLHLHLAARPVLISYLFMALVVEVWQRRREPLRRDWILLTIVFVAWANLHAGWAAALAFLCLAVAGRMIDRFRNRVDGDEAPVIPWIGMIMVCGLATFFNPWGWALHRHVYLLATSYKSFGLWDEYAEPDFRGPGMSAITVLAILAVIFALRAVRRAPAWRWEMVLPVLFFLAEGLKYQRHVLLLMIVVAVPLARDLEALLDAVWWSNVRGLMRELQARPTSAEGRSFPDLLGRGLAELQYQSREFQATHRLAAGDAWLSLCVLIVAGGMFLSLPVSHNISVGKSITSKLMTFVRDHPDRFQRPLVTTWNAGPLLWNLRPGFRVSFDDRGDFYGDPTVYSFVGLYNSSPGWRDTLAKGRYDSAILDNYLALGDNLTLLPGWTKVYHDEKTTVFWRKAH